MPYKYENGKWTWIPESSNPSSGGSSTSKPSTSTNTRPPTTSNIKDPGTLTDISDGSTTSTGSDATKDYVEQVVHSFSSSGYTQTINVSRDGFGDKLKKGR